MEEDAQDMIDEEEIPRGKNSKSDSEGGTELLKEAILDLDRELARIRKEKTSLNSDIKKIAVETEPETNKLIIILGIKNII